MMLCALFIVTIYICSVHAATFNDSDALYTFLTSGRNKNLRPHYDTNTQTDVYLDFYLLNLQEIDAVEGTVSLTGYFQVSWNDPNLVWDGAAYNYIYSMQVPENTIWTPPLINTNSAREMKLLGIEGLLATVVYDGNITWYPGQNLKFSCNIDTTYFPFDEQECGLSFIAWGYGAYDLLLYSSFKTAQTQLYNENSEWDLLRTSVQISNSISGNIATFTFAFKRKPVFLVTTLILPASLLSLLNIAVFLLPQDSGERVGFSITLLLAVVVYLTIAQGLLPATATPRLSSIYILLMINLITSGLILVSVIISAKFYYKPEKIKVPKWLHKLSNLKCNNKIKISSEKNEENVIHVREKDSSLEEEKVNEKTMTGAEAAGIWDTINILGYLAIFLVGNLAYILDIHFGTSTQDNS